MTLDHPDHAAPPTDDDEAAFLPATTEKITIQVTNDGSFDPATYDAEAGWSCAVVRAPGSSFVGSVQVKDGTKVIATWAVDPNASYTVPTPPTTPVSYTLSTGALTASNGTINIGTKPPMCPKPPHRAP